MSDDKRHHPKGGGADPRIVVAGAGSIGCFVGGLLAASGLAVTLLARERIIADINEHGLTLTDYADLNTGVSADQVTLSTTSECLADADLILVCVKTGATAEMAGLIQSHAPPSAFVLSLQNGLEGCATLRRTLAGHDVRAGMVPFNVVPAGPGRYHRASSGDIVIEAGPDDVAARLSVPGLSVTETSDITAVQWGKLLANLNNALNALSGLTLHDMLMSRDWRRLMADQMEEATKVLKAAGIKAKPMTPLPLSLVPFVLRLPTAIFSRIAAQMLTIDPSARMSMSYDLMQGRPTEIESLQGAIIALGQQHGVSTPVSNRLRRALLEAEEKGQGLPGLSPVALR